MSTPNPNAAQIQELLNAGELLPATVVLDGIIMTASSIGVAPQYGPNGWGLVGTEIGGLSSQGNDALIAELNAAGGINAQIGAWFQANCSKVISRFWAKPCAFGFAVQDNRFATPSSFAPLTLPQYNENIENGVACNNHWFLEGWFGDNAIRNLYRGEPDKTPFAVLDKVKEYDDTNNPAAGLQWFDLAYFNLLGGFKGAAYLNYGRPDPSKNITGHVVADAFTDTQTDANWTRLQRSRARAMGATIPA